MRSTNIKFTEHKVSLSDRWLGNGHRSGILWFTGLSASGKTTLAFELEWPGEIMSFAGISSRYVPPFASEFLVYTADLALEYGLEQVLAHVSEEFGIG